MIFLRLFLLGYAQLFSLYRLHATAYCRVRKEKKIKKMYLWILRNRKNTIYIQTNNAQTVAILNGVFPNPLCATQRRASI